MKIRRNAICAALSLALISCGGGGDEGTVTTPTPTPTPTPTIQTRNVLYIGGSITQGGGGRRGYTDIITDWLKTRYDVVNALNIAIGSQTSEFAVYRFEQDVGAFKPDIAFIEFTMNDSEQTREQITAHIDALIYKLRKLNPDVVITYLESTKPGEEATRRAGDRDIRGVWAQAVAERNGIGFADLGAPFWRDVIANSLDASTFFMDWIHPNNDGYAVYGAAATDYLTGYLPTAKGSGTISSYYVARSKMDTARLVDPLDAVSSTTCKASSLDRTEFIGQQKGYFDHSYDCGEGDTITVSFSGTAIGVIRPFYVDGGLFSCRLDGGDPLVNSTRQNWPWIGPAILFKNLANGPHSMTCTTTGGPVTFGDFMVSEEQTLNLDND